MLRVSFFFWRRQQIHFIFRRHRTFLNATHSISWTETKEISKILYISCWPSCTRRCTLANIRWKRNVICMHAWRNCTHNSHQWKRYVAVGTQTPLHTIRNDSIERFLWFWKIFTHHGEIQLVATKSIKYLKKKINFLLFSVSFQLKEEITMTAEKKTSYLTWVGLGLMSVQFGVLARLTWWEYSWDIMEPVTYFVTYGTAMAAYAYYCLTKQVKFSMHNQNQQRTHQTFKLDQMLSNTVICY